MKPGNKDMSFHTARERQKTNCHVSDVIMEVISALGLGSDWHLANEPKNDGEIMRGKRPENVFLTPDFSKIQTVRIDVLNPSQLSLIDKFLQFQNRRMIPKEVPHHQNAILL